MVLLMAKPVHIHDVLRQRLLLCVERPKPKFEGATQDVPPEKRHLLFEKLWETQTSETFITYMRNRLCMGALRYGDIPEQRKKGSKYDVLSPITNKVELYEKTGNTEYLVDAANYLLLVFELDKHPNKHWEALDDHHDHCKIKKPHSHENKKAAQTRKETQVKKQAPARSR
jgi:hypothetical protein